MLDQEIINLYLERSEQAITQTDMKYGKYCHSIARRILADEQDSEECVNDTWLHAWNAIPPQIPQILRAFLGKITRNLALNCYESRNAQKRGSGETQVCLDELAECLSGNDPLDQMADRMALTQCLNQFLGGQKSQDRKLFVRRYWYMVPVRELALEFGFSESKVKMKLLRMRNHLKEALEKEGIDL